MITLLLACASPTVTPDTGFGSPAEAVDEDPADDVVKVTLTADEVDGAAAAETHTHRSVAPTTTTATTTGTYAYNGQVPGPTIRARVGDLVEVTLENDLGVATSVHWHGIEVDAALDGGVDYAVEPGSSMSFSFPVERAGTFWYHSGVEVSTQVEGGLYGAFIVEDPEEPTAERELVVLWQATAGGTGSHDDAADADAHDEDTGHVDERARSEAPHDHDDHAVSDPADLSWIANGVLLPTYLWPADERVRVRMINVAALGYLDLRWSGMRRIAGDQGLLGALDEAPSTILGPGDRAEFEWNVSALTVSTGLYAEAGGTALGDPVPLMYAVGGGADPVAWSFSGTPPTADPGRTDLVFVLGGGGDETWMVNGAPWPETVPLGANLGEEVILEVRNLSAAEHAVHLHGAPFEVLSINGVPPASQDWEDTLNVPIQAIARLRWTPNKPGDWSFHCQAHAHEDGGMKTVIHVE